MVKSDFIVGILGNIISVLSFASPIGIFWEIFKTKSSDRYEGVPYVSSLLSTSLWTFYGVLKPHGDGLFIITVNSVGMASQIFYISIYLYYATKPTKMKYMGFVILEIVFIGAVMVVTLLAFHGHARRTFLGVLSATFTTVMYAAPLSVVKTVMRTKSVIYMPFFLSLSLVVNAGVWFAFAILVTDLYVLVPNAVGIVLGSLQLVVYAIYWKRTGIAVPKPSMEINDDDQITQETKTKETNDHIAV